jgi:hypothetical protein
MYMKAVDSATLARGTEIEITPEMIKAGAGYLSVFRWDDRLRVLSVARQPVYQAAYVTGLIAFPISAIWAACASSLLFQILA